MDGSAHMPMIERGSIVITGGAGFLGLRLAKKLLALGSLTGPDGQPCAIGRFLLLDQVAAVGTTDDRIEMRAGDISNAHWLAAAIGPDTGSIFHLAAVVSGQAEADFDLGMRVNLDATRALLDLCRRLPRAPRLVLASSVAVFGGELPEIVRDDTALNPQSSYGTEKAIGELLVNDYSRRGFVDGRSLRLPTIVVRPGPPNRAASSFASGIIREPLSGLPAACPVAAGTRLWLLSPRKAIESLILGHELPTVALGRNRSLSLPGLSVTVAEMVAALERVAGKRATGLIRWEFDPAVDRIVSSWPGAFDTARAQRLGFSADPDFESIIRAYIEDEAIPG